MRILTIGLAALLAVSACTAGEKSGDKTVAETTPATRARSAALTANAIAANPGAADSILDAAGYTRDSYQKLMYEIAADSALSAEFASVKRQ